MRFISYNGNTPRAIYNKLYDKILVDTDVRKGIWFSVGRPIPILLPTTDPGGV